MHATLFYSALCCFKMMLWKWVGKSPWASHRRIHKASELLICSLVFYCFCFRKWIPGVLKCADCLMGLVDLCCRKREYKEHALGLDFTCLVRVVTMDFCFPKSPFPRDLGCFVVMEILWQSSLVIFLEREKYLSNVIGLIHVKCRLCNFQRFYSHIVFGMRVRGCISPPNISI